MNGWVMRAAVIGAALTLAACATSPRTRVFPPAAAISSPAATIAAAPAGPRRLIVSRALAMVGEPYRWGGDAPGGFDCSGLVVYAGDGAGLHLPRTAHEQIRSGVSIARKQVQAGDLVFMRLEHKELHVGIALDNERFIHAPSTGRTVRVDWLDASPYSEGFLTARRIVAN